MALASPFSLTGMLQLAGRIACLIVIAWFAVFAIDQTGDASARQQSQINEESTRGSAARHSTTSGGASKSTLDEVSEAITSPFAAAVPDSRSEWTSHVVRTLLALLVYGLGIGFLVRFIRMRR